MGLPIWAAETLPHVEDISGKAGLKDKVKGSLVIDEKEKSPGLAAKILFHRDNAKKPPAP